MSVAIEVEDLSKAYQLGQFSTGTLSRDIERWWALLRGRKDPFLKIGQENDRSLKATSDIVWSLKDINFSVAHGDAVGIIGKNGAGKSTLLKLLSQVTSPTTGNIRIKGRIASLLEVGTGFHPELTGRENIFLNGAILGMRKTEIQSKFDEIVDFSGVERYIDTPVKRYSSGMYVRLAFAVAAHLETDILVVDEVLAVGDAEFQKKCLGKMKDVSVNHGKTVLFVSHNLAAVQNLCNKGILLKNGRIISDDSISEVIKIYSSRVENLNCEVAFDDATERIGSGLMQFNWVRIQNPAGQLNNEFSIGDTIVFQFEISNRTGVKRSELAVQIMTSEGMPVFHMMARDSGFEVRHDGATEVYSVVLEDIRLFPGVYSVNLTCANTTGHEVFDSVEDCISFSILDGGIYTSRSLPRAAGLFFLNPKWVKEK